MNTTNEHHSGPVVMLGVMLVRMSITNEHHSRVGVMAISDNNNLTIIYTYMLYTLYNNSTNNTTTNNNTDNNNSTNTNNKTNEHHSGPGVMLISDAR